MKLLTLLALGLVLSEAISTSDWEAYKRKFNKVYTIDEEYRRSVFSQNMASYAELNALEPLAHYGPTKFSDMTPKEYLYGYKPSTIILPELEVDTSLKIPTSQDWTGIYTSPIKDQGSCGSCWAQSAVEQVESDAMRQYNWTGVLSAQELVDCTKDGQGSWRAGCDGGSPTSGYGVLQAVGGVASGYDYKYTGRDGECKINDYKKYVKVVSYKSVGKRDETAMKSYIGSTGPLSVCVDAKSWHGYTGGIKTTCGTSTDHCVQVVGYGVDNGVQYWKVRNSWGPSWGEKGHIRLKIGSNLCNIANSPTATSTEAVANAPIPSPNGCTDSPIDWTADGDTCNLYDTNSLCTADGQQGPGWNECEWGKITDYKDRNGKTALDACCACGGGSKKTIPLIVQQTEIRTPVPDSCVDYPSNWSVEGEDCCTYTWNYYCNSDGSEGRSWDSSWGKISDYKDKNGYSAADACCGCGGGKRS